MFTWIEGNINSLIVTISQNAITLNQNAANLFKHVKYVSVGIDYAQKLLALHPATKDEIDKNIVTPEQLHRISLGNGYGKITNKGLCQMIQSLVDYQFENTKYKAEFDEINKLLIVDITKPIEKGEV